MKEQKRKRQRGVVLTDQGLKKLQAAVSKAEIEQNNCIPYTLEVLSDRIGIDPHTLSKVFRCENKVDKRTLNYCFKAFNLELESNDYFQPRCKVESAVQNPLPFLKPENESKIQNHIDWGKAPDIPVFYGRTAELATLKKWIGVDSCRLVALWGMGGIGKTSLTAKLVEQIREQFEFVIWRSLSHAPALLQLLKELIQFFPKQTITDLPETIEGKISQLIYYLRASRCLLVFDNFEKILRSGKTPNQSCNCLAGTYRQGYEGYGQLLKRLGEERHRSCLLLTSREKPKEITQIQGKSSPVRVLKVNGLQVTQAQNICQDKCFASKSQTEWSQLIEYFEGNPLFLMIVCGTIQDLFDGCIDEFLKQKTLIFGDICTFLDQEFRCLSDKEQKIMICLAKQSEPISFSQLLSQLRSSISVKDLLEILESLEALALLEPKAARFSLQPILSDYLACEIGR